MKPTIKDVQAFARYHGLPVPDGFVASASGGIVYSHPENYVVVAVLTSSGKWQR